MIKREKIFASLILLLIIGISLSSSEVITASNISIKSNYSRGEFLSGTFNLTLKDVNPFGYLTSNLGHKISIRDFLENNSERLDCESYGCEDRYSNNSGSINSFILPANSNKILGLLVESEEDERVNSLEKIKINLSSSFVENSTVPLKISLFDGDYNWFYLDSSENYNRYRSYGKFNTSKPHDGEPIKLDVEEKCIEIKDINYTNKVRMGLNYSTQEDDEGPATIIMTLYDITEGNDQIAKCNFTASTNGNNFCTTPLFEEKTILEGNYELCANRENENGREVWVEKQANNYAFFIDLPKYKAFTNGILDLKLDSEEFKYKSENYLSEVYSSYCSNGCFIPFNISSPHQVTINSLSAEINREEGVTSTSRFYELEKTPTRGNFEGVLNLDKAKFLADFEGDKTLRIFIDSNSGEKEIFNTTIKMIERKLDILNIFPSIIPAGVPILFGALILNTTNITSYKWNFGDGEIKTTTESGILKTYSNITNYNISLNVSDSSNLSVQKNFSIETISPKDYINRTLNESEKKLNNITLKIDSLDTPFKNKIKEKLDIDNLRSNLTSIKQDVSQATTPENWLNIALKLSELKIPIDIWEDRIDEGIFVSDSSQIDLEIVGAIFGKTISNSDYKSLISSWEIMNVNGTKKKVKLLYKDYSGEEKTLAEIYKIEVNPKEKSYLVVSKGNGIESSESLSEKGTGKVLELSPGIKKSLELISFDSANRDIYVVIDPTNVELAGEITVCNFNGICEAKLGENYKNCRDDCKPWPRMIILLVVIIVLFFVVYTFIQIQMKKKYELHLFKSEQELQNLIESIKNSRDNNISYNEITDKLIKHGWSKEQINYAIKKSRGEKTRPYELIPMDRILDSFKKKKKNEKLDKKTK